MIGLSLERAQQRLRAADLAVGVVSVRNGVPKAQAGIVLNQAPASGRSVDPGAAVALIVGGVPAPTLVTVPNVVGLTAGHAQQKLQTIGLTLGPVSPNYDAPNDKVGVVLAQIPGVGSSTTPGSSVALTVGAASIVNLAPTPSPPIKPLSPLSPPETPKQSPPKPVRPL